jgi:predicted oxidoreductase (fatty acid repression mutant protein)
MVFAREMTPEVEKLISKLDSCAAKNSECKMGSFVVFCSDDEGLQTKLQKVAEKAELKKVVLSIDNPAGPEKYNVSKDAAVTVILYKDRTVKANFTFAKSADLTDKAIDSILADTSKITK